MSIVAALLADDRREVSAAAIAALTGILSALPDDEINAMVNKYAKLATKSKMKRTKKDTNNMEEDDESDLCWAKEQKRIRNQQSSVFFLCAAVNSQPYETPSYVPVALAAISKHSFERNAPLGVRDAVKRCCADYKKTHMSDNWELHRKVFTQEQLESLEDVVSSPHYYA
jgi:proteasome activator subunit 4